MSATAEHTHTWVGTPLHYATFGPKWQQWKSVLYCPECRRFGYLTNLYLDGNFFKTQREADAACHDMREQHRTEREAWLREHYPAHVASESA